MHEPASKRIAYVLKGYPRLSETFISSEIYRLEKAGVGLKIFVINQDEERAQHPITEKIKTQPVYLPKATTSSVPVISWLQENFPRFKSALKSIIRQKPIRTLKAGMIALDLSFKARVSFFAAPKKKYLKEFFQAIALAEEISKHPEIAHLHAHFSHGATTVAWLAAIITQKTFSFTAHAKDIYSKDLNPNGLLRRKMDKAEFVVTCTEANKQHLDSLGSKTKVHTIYHGLNADFAELLESSEAPSPMNGVLRTLAVGRMVEKKGFDIFVDACRILQNQGIKFSAKIIGEGGEHESEIKRRIAEYGFGDKFQILKPMTQGDLFKEYNRADVFCLPCRVVENGDRDGIPNVLAEAMACGLSVVSTNVSGIPEIVKDRINGLLVKPDSAKDVAEALINIKQESGLKDRLGKEAKATISEKFDADKHIQKLISLFREVM